MVNVTSCFSLNNRGRSGTRLFAASDSMQRNTNCESNSFQNNSCGHDRNVSSIVGYVLTSDWNNFPRRKVLRDSRHRSAEKRERRACLRNKETNLFVRNAVARRSVARERWIPCTVRWFRRRWNFPLCGSPAMNLEFLMDVDRATAAVAPWAYVRPNHFLNFG